LQDLRAANDANRVIHALAGGNSSAVATSLQDGPLKLLEDAASKLAVAPGDSVFVRRPLDWTAGCTDGQAWPPLRGQGDEAAATLDGRRLFASADNAALPYPAQPASASLTPGGPPASAWISARVIKARPPKHAGGMPAFDLSVSVVVDVSEVSTSSDRPEPAQAGRSKDSGRDGSDGVMEVVDEDSEAEHEEEQEEEEAEDGGGAFVDSAAISKKASKRASSSKKRIALPRKQKAGKQASMGYAVSCSLSRTVTLVLRRVPLAHINGSDVTVLVLPSVSAPPMSVLRSTSHMGVVSEALQVFTCHNPRF
jgi:hypothetical protein